MKDSGAACGGFARLDFPTNTVSQSYLCDLGKRENCPNINVCGAPMSRMGMCYR